MTDSLSLDTNTKAHTYTLNQLPSWLVSILSLVFGALIPLSLAPFNIWPLGILALIGFYFIIHNTSFKKLFLNAWLFGVGAYGLGTSWIYVSISGYGGAPAPLAVFLVAVFVASMSLLFILPFLIFHRTLKTQGFIYALAFACLWTLNEWMHTWLLTGFPWLLVGYAHINTWLSGFAPVSSVLGVGFFLALLAASVAQLIELKLLHQLSRNIIAINIASIVIILSLGFFLSSIQWTQISSSPTQIAILQPNIDQDDKWQEENLEPTLKLLKEETTKLLDNPLRKNKMIVWPESAVPLTYNQAIPFLNEINREAADHHAGVITGIIYDDIYQHKYFNSVAAFGDAIGVYHKRRLVPFGEYVPLEHWLRGLIEFFDLPTSIISFGDEDQHHLKMDDLLISPSVCYEVAYPELVAKSAIDSNLLISVSNLGWFRDSLGRHQFLQMARMRALETQRYHLYSTNNGPSAVFDTKGNSVAETPAFVQTQLESSIFSASGKTPFMTWGNWPLVSLCFIFLVFAYIQQRKK